MTINALFQETVAAHGAKTALRYKENKQWHDISYAELNRRVEIIASAFAALGVRKGDRVALLSENRPEWAITDLAALSLGAIIVPLYPTLPTPQVAFIVRNAAAKLFVVSDARQLAKAMASRHELPELEHIVLIDGETPADSPDVVTWATLLERGAAEPLGDRLSDLRKDVLPDDVASLVYTSGTTGDPKGAMLTHRNIVTNVDYALEHFARQGEKVDEKDTFLSFLPLSHVFERVPGYYLPLRTGAAIAYCEGVRTIVDDMASTKPTIMVCVPRVYEAMQERILAQVEKLDAGKKAGFRKALESGKEYAEAKRRGGMMNPMLAMQHALFEKLVYHDIRERFGGALRFFVSGGAALNAETARFFEAIGIPIVEGYGMTETAPVIAINPNRRLKLGTVGICIPGGEIKIAEDGEILYRGPNVMKGYWRNDQATHDMIDSTGWLHTGDVGHLDEEGYLKITDRKKDLLVLHNGKKVAPQPIESTLKQSPFIEEIVLIGDRQSIVTALVIPNKGRLTEWAKAENLSFDGEEELLRRPEVRKKIKQEIDAQSGGLADFEKIRKFTILNTAFTVDSGELTPTLKVKRKVVAQKFAREIAAMAGESE
ncbi:MAG: long-chain fatty acid--CoA ligase [Capsulimonadales bacterium]|nr:long-chain fatty acid--CoA ligase [Capsulimonadales bacterium]